MCLALGAVAALMACDDSRSCETSGDCFSDESCIGGTCLADENAGQGNHGDSDTDVDASGDAGEPGEVVSCLVDRINAPSCSDPYESTPYSEHNDSSVYGYEFDFDQAGCITDGEFTPAEETLSATNCFDEREDWYKFQLFGCRDTQFRVQVDVFPDDRCETPVELRGYDCDSENVRCETLDDGTLRQTRVYLRDSHRQISLPSFGVVSIVDDQQVDYTLNVKVFR
jgi:hypothetical protein